MTWKRALEADARLAAKNATKFRAALRASINPESIVEGYMQTQPQPIGNVAQQRARARSWAIMNVRVNLSVFQEVLLRTLAEGYVLGDRAALDLVEQAKARQKAPKVGINWDTWKPGDDVAALFVKPPKAWRNLLARFDITLKDFSKTTHDLIGNSLGESIELGLSGKQTAKRLLQYVASPSRALTIAITEQNRAISAATVARYKEMGVEKNEWLASDPCEECAENDGQVVPVGSPFASGDDQPPVHPNCRCTLLPVVLGGEGDEGDDYITEITD